MPMNNLSIQSLPQPNEVVEEYTGLKWIPVLVYHKVDTRFEFGITHVFPRQFARQMAWLHENGYQTISFREYLENPFWDQNQKYVIITFDDAYQSVYKNAFPIMRQYNFTATVFVVSDFVGRRNLWDVNLGGFKFSHLNWFEMYQLVKSGWEIGSHTATHQDLIACSDDELEYEVVRSKLVLERCIGGGVSVIAYPFGRYNQRIKDWVCEAGYTSACTTDFGTHEPPENAFGINRQAVHLWDTIFDFKAKIEMNRYTEFQRIRQNGINFCAQGTVVVKNFKKKYLQF